MQFAFEVSCWASAVFCLGAGNREGVSMGLHRWLFVGSLLLELPFGLLHVFVFVETGAVATEETFC